MKRRLDTTYFGAFFGLVIPFIFSLLFLRSIHVALDWNSITSFLNTPSLLVKFICVALFPDMGAVFVFNSLEMWKACRGVFGAIGIYTMAAIITFFL